MAISLHQAWLSILAEDYDAHMTATGQAQANAALVAAFFEVAAPAAGSAILVAGAGTGQMFDYLGRAVFYPFQTTFADINTWFLTRLAERLRDDRKLRFEAVIDDVQNSRLGGRYALAIAILLLEHVDWRRAVATLCRLSDRVFVVIQENPPRGAPVRPPVGSVAVLLEARPHPVPPTELEEAFAAAGFVQVRCAAASVPDAKRMIALEFAAFAAADIP